MLGISSPAGVANGMADGTRSGPATLTNGHGAADLPEALEAQIAQAEVEEMHRETAPPAAQAAARTREPHAHTRKQEYVDLLDPQLSRSRAHDRQARSAGHAAADAAGTGAGALRLHRSRSGPPLLDRYDARAERADAARIIDRLRNTYCRSIGVQFMHMDDLSVRQWLQDRMEGTKNRLTLTRDEQIADSHAADRRRDLRGVHSEASSWAPRAFRWKGPKA